MIGDWKATFALRDAIAAEDANIAGALQARSSVALVRSIRHWWAGFVNIGTNDQGESRNLSATGLLIQHRDKALSAQCSGMANALAKIYTEFGFPACEYGTHVNGTNCGLSHATTLVEIVIGGNKLVLVQDPLGDCEARIDGQDYSDFRDILNHASAGGAVACYSPWAPAVRSRLSATSPPSVVGQEAAFDLNAWFFDASHNPALGVMARLMGRDPVSMADLLMFHQYSICASNGTALAEAIALGQSMAASLYA